MTAQSKTAAATSFFLAVGTVSTSLFFVSPTAAQKNSPQTANSVVAGIPVTSGTAAEVRALLQKKLGAKLDANITLTDGATTVTRTRREWGVHLDLDRMLRGVSANQKYVPLILRADDADMKQALRQVAAKFAFAGRAAKPYIYKGKLHIQPDTYQRTLDVAATAGKLAQSVESDASTRQVRVSLDKTPPALTAAKLNGITGTLASFSTTAAANPSRNTNIAIAVEAINNTLLSPGETFSLNDIVGKRTKERGFEEAHVFVDRKIVPGVGGGVSQVTGTLFNAAALAGLRIDEVNPHSRPVSYIPLGRDATVAWQAKDLKFTNKTDAPVYIAYTFKENTRRLRATLYGKKIGGQQISLRPQVQKLGPGKIDADLYRVVKQDGKVIVKERLFRHKYRWDPKAK